MNIKNYLTPYGSKPKLQYFQYRYGEKIYFSALDLAEKDGRLAILLTQPACGPGSLFNHRDTIANTLYILLYQAKLINNPSDIDWYNLFLSDTADVSSLKYFKVHPHWNGAEYTEDYQISKSLIEHINSDLFPFDLTEFLQARFH